MLMLFFFFFRPHWVGCGTLVLQPRVKPVPQAMELCSLTHWITKEVPLMLFLLPWLPLCQRYSGCVDILLGSFCHLHMLFFSSSCKPCLLRNMSSFHSAFQLSPWLTFTNLTSFESENESLSVVSDSLWLLCPWNSPGKDTGVGCHSLLRGICPTQR